MDSSTKRSVIKKFVNNISKPLSLDENLSLIVNVFNDLKQFKLETDDYGYLWKGIFYSIWYTEMNKGCEQIVDKLYELANSKLIVHGFEALNKDWFSIDYIRIDKYMYLARRLTHKLILLQFNQFVKFHKSTEQSIKQSATKSSNVKKPNQLKTALSKLDGVGLIDHFLDIFYTECFKIISPFLGSSKQKTLIAEFLISINKALINRLASSAKDDRVLKVVKIEFFNLYNHLKRNKYILERTMNSLIVQCNRSPCKEIRLTGNSLQRRFSKLLVVREQQPEILEPRAKPTYNRKKALKNKALRLQNKKRKLRVVQEAKLKEEQSKITEISAEEQFNALVGI